MILKVTTVMAASLFKRERKRGHRLELPDAQFSKIKDELRKKNKALKAQAEAVVFEWYVFIKRLQSF